MEGSGVGRSGVLIRGVFCVLVSPQCLIRIFSLWNIFVVFVRDEVWGFRENGFVPSVGDVCVGGGSLGKR